MSEAVGRHSRVVLIIFRPSLLNSTTTHNGSISIIKTYVLPAVSYLTHAAFVYYY